jgi:hypothetical protein
MEHRGEKRDYLGLATTTFRRIHWEVCKTCKAYRDRGGVGFRGGLVGAGSWRRGHPGEPGERQPQCPGAMEVVEGEMVLDIDDVWDGVKLDNEGARVNRTS